MLTLPWLDEENAACIEHVHPRNTKQEEGTGRQRDSIQEWFDLFRTRLNGLR